MELAVRLVKTEKLDVLVWLCSANDLPSAEWSRACEVLREIVHRKAGDLSSFREFVVTDGAAPDAVQRKEYQAAYGGYSGITAVVTTVVATNPFKRGIATAMSWMNPNIRFFAPRDIHRSFNHVGLAHTGFDPIWAALQGLKTDLPPNRTLPLIARALDLSPTPSATQPLATKDRYGPYEPVRRLGSGGTAEVFEARHVDLGTRVALKVLHGSASGAERATKSVIDEGRAVAALRHPHVVALLDVGHRGKVPYLAMELLEGETLAQWCSTHHVMEVAQAVDLILPVLSGMSAVHAAGLVHRDLKPSNVFLAERQGSIEPVIIDFGLSKFVDPIANGPATTHLGAGTPQYMSPEQVRGLRATGRSDQYAIAVLLYELVTGGLPFWGDDRYELLHAIVTARVIPPSEVSPCVPGAFDEVLLRAIAREPEARFPNVRAFGEALLAFASKTGWRKWHKEFSSVHGNASGAYRAWLR